MKNSIAQESCAKQAEELENAENLNKTEGDSSVTRMSYRELLSNKEWQE